MSRFQRIIDDNRRAVNNVSNPNPTVPMYQINEKVTKGKKEKKRREKSYWNKYTISLVVAGCVLGFIYLPQLFMKDEVINNKLSDALSYSDVAKLDYMASTENPDGDYDNDGLTNQEERDAGTDCWNIDTDNTGVSDYYKIKNLGKREIDNDTLLNQVKELDKTNGVSLSSPYKMNNVILWPDDYESKAYGGVIETTAGYRFTNFKGYAQFPNYDSIYAYKYENGKRVELEYLEKEKAWYIDGDVYVEIYNEPLEYVVKYNFFGSTSYKKGNFFSKTLAFILPDKGFITATKMTSIDAEPDTRERCSAKIQSVSYDEDDYTRLTKNNTTLEDLVYVRNTIKEGTCVAVSLYSFEYGEAIAIVYGYTYTGDLLLADIETLTPIGSLTIEEKCKKMINNNGEIVSYSYFDFSGYGFDSENGDRISFFAISK